MIKAVIFDWNGVVIDDLEATGRANCDVIEALGGQRVSLGTWYKELEQDWRIFFMKYGVRKEDLAKVYPLMDTYYPKYLEYAIIYPDTIKSLRKLQTMGITMGILSGINRKSIDVNVKRYGLENIFSFIISGQDVKEQKPNPEGLLRAIKLCKVPSREIIYVDDMDTMFPEAERLEMTTIGFRSKLSNDLSAACHKINSMPEIIKIISRF